MAAASSSASGGGSAGSGRRCEAARAAAALASTSARRCSPQRCPGASTGTAQAAPSSSGHPQECPLTRLLSTAGPGGGVGALGGQLGTPTLLFDLRERCLPGTKGVVVGVGHLQAGAQVEAGRREDPVEGGEGRLA